MSMVLITVMDDTRFIRVPLRDDLESFFAEVQQTLEQPDTTRLYAGSYFLHINTQRVSTFLFLGLPLIVRISPIIFPSVTYRTLTGKTGYLYHVGDSVRELLEKFSTQENWVWDTNTMTIYKGKIMPVSSKISSVGYQTGDIIHVVRRMRGAPANYIEQDGTLQISHEGFYHRTVFGNIVAEACCDNREVHSCVLQVLAERNESVNEFKCTQCGHPLQRIDYYGFFNCIGRYSVLLDGETIPQRGIINAKSKYVRIPVDATKVKRIAMMVDDCQDECFICQTGIGSVKTKCRYCDTIFDEHCLRSWLTRNSCCPWCRHILGAIFKKYVTEFEDLTIYFS
jgi:hypothetical protein